MLRAIEPQENRGVTFHKLSHISHFTPFLTKNKEKTLSIQEMKSAK